MLTVLILLISLLYVCEESRVNATKRRKMIKTALVLSVSLGALLACFILCFAKKYKDWKVTANSGNTLEL